ncbi:RNA polymerase sigma factor [Sediminicola luteus]|uniref:RNA polymerase sigma-70 region 2 domain-containing protein n=1 Tax=Sediminicola luteus TaxID=319238 RepID=A0A2A4G1X5_9FLAO|nr:sigma-70 family RNA polymerase sigma factor [Sediminicola luteus]PCE62979.1 hypothetical protein B7P33_17030 [Sediminicola luteus]
MGDTLPENNHNILIGFRQNDQDILEGIYRTVYPKVEVYVLNNKGTTQQAKDIFQEAFISCWRNIKEEKFVTGNVAGYLFTIARNKWVDTLRSPKFKKTVKLDMSLFSVSNDPTEGEPPQIGPQRDKRSALQAAMGRLGPQCRQLLTLFYFERRSIADIARTTGLTPGSTRNQKYRCMQKLKSLSHKILNHG